MSEKALNKKNVIITGAGIGIGKATALAFGKKNYRVIVTDILEAEGLQTVAEINTAGGVAEFHILDVTSTPQTDALVNDIETLYGPIDCLVANAGIAHRIPLDELTDEKWDRTFDIDLKGMMRLVRAAAGKMKTLDDGSIICLSSIMGVAYGWDEHVAYSAAKAGVVGLVRALAVELAKDGIRVNGVAPGYIKTAQALSVQHSLGEAGLEQAASFIPMGRVGDPEDIADVIVFLASDSSRYLTGQVLTVDGGLMVGRY
ncbi:MAG: SDR family oxidoreductase [Rhizobiales bacterium]|nr:SDR family oxidoreductase [Hyphomicrobiales bacterium]